MGHVSYREWILRLMLNLRDGAPLNLSRYTDGALDVMLHTDRDESATYYLVQYGAGWEKAFDSVMTIISTELKERRK